MPNIPLREPRTRLRKHLPQPEALQLIPEAMARQYTAIPLEVNDDVLQVAMANPADILALEALATQSQMRIEPEIAGAEEIQEAIDFNYQSYDEIEKQISSISVPSETIEERIRLDTVTDAPVARALTLIIDEAVKARASDIHLQPQEDKLRVRYRIDGALHDMLSLPLVTATPLISRIKILANMNIADHHRPQDGQFSVKTKGRRSIDIRVGIIATVYGESVALRLLDKSKAIMSLSELGFLPESLAKYEEMLKVPYGMILVSGPTGAGKTTTLYASVNCLDLNGRNIITIEDPIEYIYPNLKCVITQRELGSDTLSFAEALKHVLRQDPDVILVGEMRDLETAAAVLTIAETGHLVLTTGHAPTAPQAIERIINLFPPHERYLAQSRLASSLLGVLCQALIPKADGLGRVPAVEIMLASTPVRSLIREGKIYQLPSTIRTQARLGMELFDQALIRLYRKGVISSENLFTFCNDRDEVTQLCGKVEVQ